MLHIIWSVVVGFIVGVIAKWLFGAVFHDPISAGFLVTVIIGIVGSVIGGAIAMLISRPPPGSQFHAAGFLLSIVGGILLLFILHSVAHVV